MNVTQLLTKDHREVESLLERYRSATAESKQVILETITGELTKHMFAEETVLYPILRASIPDGESLMNEAVEEHRKARGLLAELENAEVGSFDMDSKVATLEQAVSHHVTEEEDEIFPQMENTLAEARLEDLGAQVENAKRSAPLHPGRSAEQDSPGASVRGMAAAAADRLKGAVGGKE
jgi:iron-sulfur cluster repair protein YtfE (RIC family)